MSNVYKRHVPRKRFGQHFLHDKNIINKIVTVLSPQPGEHLIEIGPGQGALTIPVLKHAYALEVIELDRDLIKELRMRTQGLGELTIHACDAFKVDLHTLKKDARLLRIFGNLPYNISTPLIFHLLKAIASIQDMLFMLQKEVADRMASHANDQAYGRLSVMLQYACRVEKLFDVSPQSFYPAPKVVSSIVRLLPYAEPPYLADDYATFAQIVQLAFGQRRKTLRNSLKKLVYDEHWQSLELSSDLRAENLTVKDFVAISNAIKTK